MLLPCSLGLEALLTKNYLPKKIHFALFPHKNPREVCPLDLLQAAFG